MKDFAKIEEIYHAALEKTLPEREGFLREVCGDDDELLREVESLLSFDEEAANFIETPPADLAASLFAPQLGEDLIGKDLNHYHVLSVLGAGGMGEVYLAEDTKLGRKTALKILPQQFSSDAERKARFVQEARAASALNHPNIITIYGIEQAENIDFIVTELVDGLTLRERITEKPFDWREAVEVALQITSALDAAHGVGIIHRDVKPANIMIRRDGYVKVLDFGLAKLMFTANGSKSYETREETAPNRVMGTINYMSPEQALGEKLDTRTDIFSLGVVIYEMLSGVQPFNGTSDAAIYNATINLAPPSLLESNAAIPPALDKIVKHALEKKRENRYQSAAELSRDLQKLKENSNLSISFENHSAAERKLKRVKFYYAIAAISVILISLAAFYFYANRSPKPPEVRAQEFKQITSNGSSLTPSLSPDGKTIIYSSRESGNWDIYLQRVGGENAINLTRNSTFDDTQAVFSPNGEQIAFSSNREGASGIFLMGATGENVRKISDFGFNPAWSPDGAELVFSNTPADDPTNRFLVPAGLWKINIASGESRKLTDGDAVQPVWSPHGDRIAFWSVNEPGNRDIRTIAREGGEAVSVTDDPEIDWNPMWSRDGKFIYFSSSRGGSMNFWRVALDEKTGKTLGNPEPFTTPSLFSQNLTFSADGKIFAYAQQVNVSNIIQAEFNPQTETLSAKTTVIGKSSRFDRNPSISPDGEWLAFDAIKDRQEDLFVMRRDGSDLLQFTNDIKKDRAPRWSPDGKQLVFYSDRSGRNESWLINPNGSGLRQITFDTEPYGLIAFWSPNGKQMVQSVSLDYPKIFNAEYPLTGQTAFQVPGENDPNIWEMPYSWSPDGEKIAQLRQGKNSELSGIVVYNLKTNKQEVMSEFGDVPVWLNDSRRLIFSDKNKLILLDTVTKKTKELMTFAPSDIMPAISVSPDNRLVYFTLQKKESNIWLGALD